jgi:lysophospholipase L1-like esterase
MQAQDIMWISTLKILARIVILARVLSLLLVFCFLAIPGWAVVLPVFATDLEAEMLGAGWTGTGSMNYGKDLVWSNQHSHSGQHSLSVIKDKDSSDETGWESPHFPVKKNQYYRVKFWAKTSQPTYWAIFFYNQRGTLIEGDHYSLVQPSPHWTEQEFYFQTKYPGVTAAIAFQPLTEQPLYIDDVRITSATRNEAQKWADRLYQRMPAIHFIPPNQQNQQLPNTIQKLNQGKSLNIVFIGDSIANDLSNSLFDVLLEAKFPQSHIQIQFTGKGSTGWLKLRQQVQQRIIIHQPDLVICQAISNDPKYLSLSLSSIINTTRKASKKTEFLLLTPHLQHWSKDKDGLVYRNVLLQIAKEQQVAVLDLMMDWNRYLTENHWPVNALLRDSLHMNEPGRQLSARIMVDYFVQTAQDR